MSNIKSAVALLLLALAAPASAAPTSAAPTPPAALARARAALDGVDVIRCLPGGAALMAGQLRVALVVYPDGAWAAAISAPEPRGAISPLFWTNVRLCVEGQLTAALNEQLARPPASATAISRTIRLETQPERPLVDIGKHDGTAGAICHVGEHWRSPGGNERFPTPAPCKRGLRCCHGGPAGSDGVCLSTPDGVCPALP